MSGTARLGIVGLGVMGTDHLRACVKNPRVEVAALCDIDAAALASAVEVAGDHVASYRDYRDMLAAGNLDGVILAVPQYLREETCTATLEAGIKTFTEKPFAMNVVECDRILETARRTGTGIMVGQVLRYLTFYRLIIETVRGGDLGRPLAMRVVRSMGSWSGSVFEASWRTKFETSGGFLLEVNVHEIDFMRNVMGEAASVTAVGGHFANDTVDYDDLIDIQMVFENGGIGNLTSVACAHQGRNGGDIYLEKGTIYYDTLGNHVSIAREGCDPERLAANEAGREYEGGFEREIREFAEYCLGEGDITIPGEEGMKAVEIAEAAYTSIRETQTVKLPLPRA